MSMNESGTDLAVVGGDERFPPHPVDPRVRLAAEPTLLAWMRTGLALMGFGFVVARFGLFIRELAGVGKPVSTRHPRLSLWSGTTPVAFLVVLNLLTGVRYLQFLRCLELGEPDRAPRWPLGFVVATLMAALGIGMTRYLFAASF
jgi:putative membrane protein